MKKTWIVLAVSVGLFSCVMRREELGPVLSETKTGNLAKVEMLTAEIRMAAGELIVEGGGKAEAKAVFEYNKGQFEPRFTFDDSSFRARLVLEQKDQAVRFSGRMKNNWRVTLADGVETDLDIKMGAGEARLTLGSVDLRRVKMGLGAGKVVADFRGTPKRDYEIEINGGVGECEVRLPRGVGLRAEAEGGLGSIDVRGLEKKGKVWENEAFEKAKVKVRLRVKGGVGSIRIEAE